MHLPLSTRVKAFAHTALATRSVRSARLLHTRSIGVAELTLPGFRATCRFRTGTSDAKFLRILVERGLPAEYALPDGLNPGVILDIGANIGAVSLALARRFPAARLYAFEPLPENYALLAHNVAALPQVTALPFGLGARTEERTYERSDNPRNFGGGGFYGGQCDPALCQARLPIVAVTEALAQLGVGRVDLIKIDSEGAEYDILTSFPQNILQQTRVIVGELHGKPHDEALLQRLSSWFNVERIWRGDRVQWFRATRLDPSPA
jgi:FkbM family methyltransferase